MKKGFRVLLALLVAAVLHSCKTPHLLKLTKHSILQGEVIYPGEACPPDLEIVAVNQETGEYFKQSGFPSVMGETPPFQLRVPSGSYYIYAYSPSFDVKYKAYYTEFVKCGLHLSCPSHERILLTLKPGETSSSIWVGDWYAQVSPNSSR